VKLGTMNLASATCSKSSWLLFAAARVNSLLSLCELLLLSLSEKLVLLDLACRTLSNGRHFFDRFWVWCRSV